MKNMGNLSTIESPYPLDSCELNSYQTQEIQEKTKHPAFLKNKHTSF